MPLSPLDSRVRWDFTRWEWIAGAVAVALLAWVASCALCSEAPEPVRAPPAPAESSGGAAPDRDAQIVALRLALDRETEAREQLALEVAALRAQLEARASASDPAAPNAGPAAPARSGLPSMFDGNSLVSAGVAPADAQELRTRWESTEMGRIRLIDRATREGWLGTVQYQEELKALESEFRGSLSDADYDRYLYATGRNNRARITDVIANSPGQTAGFRPGDTIVSYGGKRVFSVEELRDLATRSDPRESIAVEVLQDGSPVTLYVRGGPIGLMLRPEHQAPR